MAMVTTDPNRAVSAHYPSALVERIVAASPGPDVLDVGCGTGIAARQFQDQRAAAIVRAGLSGGEQWRAADEQPPRMLTATTLQAQDCSLRMRSSTTSLTTWSAAVARIMALIPRARVILLSGSSSSTPALASQRFRI